MPLGPGYGPHSRARIAEEEIRADRERELAGEADEDRQAQHVVVTAEDEVMARLARQRAERERDRPGPSTSG